MRHLLIPVFFVVFIRLVYTEDLNRIHSLLDRTTNYSVNMSQPSHPQMGVSVTNGSTNEGEQQHPIADQQENLTVAAAQQPTANASQAGQTQIREVAPQLCRLGQETAQEIVNKTMELFQFLRTAIPPNGTAQSNQVQEDRKTKIRQTLHVIALLFDKLRKVYNRVNEATTEMEFVQIESLIPLKEHERDHHHHHRQSLEEKKKTSETMRNLTQERSNLMEQLRIRNRQLKDIIDMLRDIVWDINTMLSMRKP